MEIGDNNEKWIFHPVQNVGIPKSQVKNEEKTLKYLGS